MSVSQKRGRNDFSSWDLPRLRDYMKKLEIEIKRFEADNLFENANEVMGQLNHLKKIENEKIYQEIKERQQKERNEISKAQKAEINAFEKEWENKQIDLDKKFIEMKEKMTDDHKKEIEDKIYWFNSNFPHNPKPSSEILNYQKILKGIVKQKQYEKASDINQLLTDKINSEKQKWNIIRDKKLKYELDSLKVKQENELINLEIKTKKILNDFKKNKSLAQEKLIQKFRNKFKELEINHKLELSEFKNINHYHAKLLSDEIISKFKYIIKEESSRNKVIFHTENSKSSSKKSV